MIKTAHRSIMDDGLVPIRSIDGLRARTRKLRAPGDLLRYCLGRIPKDEAAAVRKVVILDWTLSKTARAFKCSRDKVRRLLRSAWDDMAKLLGEARPGRAPRQRGRTPRISIGSHTSVAWAGSNKTVLKFEGINRTSSEAIPLPSVAFVDEMCGVPHAVFAGLSNVAGGGVSENALN